MIETKVCIECGEERLLSEFHSAGNSGKYRRRVCKYCRSEARIDARKDPVYAANERKKRNEQYARMTRRDFESAIQHYGGKCSMCGEDRADALVLHHKIRKDGRKELEITKKGHPWFYSTLRKLGYPKGLIVLCGTCHLILHRKSMRGGNIK